AIGAGSETWPNTPAVSAGSSGSASASGEPAVDDTAAATAEAAPASADASATTTGLAASALAALGCDWLVLDFPATAGEARRPTVPTTATRMVFMVWLL